MLLIKLKRLILWIQRLFLRHEPKLSPTHPEPSLAPIFIVGAPRTGSTLLFQLLVKHYRLAYYSNLMALFPMFASRIGRFTRQRILGYDQIKKSEYGIIRGLHSPNEASKINDFWFQQADSEAHCSRVAAAVAHLSNGLNAPLLVKALGNALRIKEVLKVFPDARFIHIQRDPLFAAQSILIGRREISGGQEHWLSLKPEGYEEIQSQRDPFYQVVWQVHAIDEAIAAALRECGAEAFNIRYSELCANTGEVLARAGRHFGLEPKSQHSPPEQLEKHESRKLSEEDWTLLKNASELVFGK